MDILTLRGARAARRSLLKRKRLAAQIKRGRVLSSKNEEKIVSARDNLNEVLAQLEEQPEQNDNANQDAAPAKDAAGLASLLDADGERDLADSLHTLTDLVKGVMK